MLKMVTNHAPQPSDSEQLSASHKAAQAHKSLQTAQKGFIRAFFAIRVARTNLEILKKLNFQEDDLDNLVQNYSVFSAFVVAYAKLYPPGDRKETSLVHRDVINKDPRWEAAHHTIDDLRNKIFAHDDVHELIVGTPHLSETPHDVRIVHNLRVELPYSKVTEFSYALDQMEKMITARVDSSCASYEEATGKKVILCAA